MYMYMYTLHKYTCIYMHVYMYLYMYIHYLSLLFQVPGKFELKGHDRVQGLSSLNVERQNQFLPGQRRDVTYVSRLQVYMYIHVHGLFILGKLTALGVLCCFAWLFI